VIPNCQDEDENEKEIEMNQENQNLDPKQLEARSALLDQVNEVKGEQADVGAQESVDALLHPEGGIEILDGKYRIPRISSRSLYLLGKINSPFAARPQFDDEGKPIGQEITADQMMDAIYVIMNQDDPRVIMTIADPIAFTNAVFNHCATIDVADLQEIGLAINQQMEGIGKAAEHEGVAGESGPGEGSGTTT